MQPIFSRASGDSRDSDHATSVENLQSAEVQ